MITTPTLADLVELNRTALRRLDRSCQRNERQGIRFVVGNKHLVEAKPVHWPAFYTVSSYRDNLSLDEIRSCSPREQPERRYHWSRFDLSFDELKFVLGRDYHGGGPMERMTSPEEVNAMWKAITDCPSDDANAYMLGELHSNMRGEVTLGVQYYRIPTRVQRSLALSTWQISYFKEREEREKKTALKLGNSYSKGHT